MNIKKIFASAFFSFFLFLGSSSVKPEDSSFEPLKEDDDIFTLIENLGDYSDNPNAILPPHHYNKREIVELFTRSCPAGIIRIQDIFGNADLYRYTHPINDRSIQDYPLFYLYSLLPTRDLCQTWQLRVIPFYNQFTKDNFTLDGTKLGSYLNLNNYELIKDIELFTTGLGYNIARLFQLASLFKIQERRAGIMFGGVYHNHTWFIEFRTPLIYQERNLHLTETEERELRSEVDPKETSKETDTEFAREHLIADRFGIGDTRINAWRRNIDNELMKFDTGFMLTLPTAYALKKGLYGTHFSKNAVVPPFDLENLLNTMSTHPAAAKTLALDFLIAALDRLSRILLESAAGNNGHVGLGIFTFYDMKLSHKFNYFARAELEYLLPILERRFYITEKNAGAIAQLSSPSSEDCSQEVQTIENTIINALFPMGYNTMVYPGILFKMTTGIKGHLGKKWSTTMGWDIWWQSKENFTRIDAPQEVRQVLRVNLAKKSTAFQAKIFASFDYVNEGRWCDWALSLYGDRTIISSGIGKDFMLGLKFECFI